MTVSVCVSERWDLSSAFERDLDREWPCELEREGLSFEEGGDEEEDEEMLP